MADTAFDTALIAAFLRLAGEQGWHRANVAAAARSADLSLAEARARFPSRAAVLKAFARMADQAALEGATSEGSVKDRLFDLMMRRFDALQAHRDGVVAVARGVVFEPPMLILMACLTRRSMRWMLQSAGVSTAGPVGELRIKGLMAVWLWTLRAWERDTSDDLSATMAALDNALTRADQMAGWLSRRDRDDAGVEPDVDLTLGGDTPEQA